MVSDDPGAFATGRRMGALGADPDGDEEACDPDPRDAHKRRGAPVGRPAHRRDLQARKECASGSEGDVPYDLFEVTSSSLSHSFRADETEPSDAAHHAT